MKAIILIGGMGTRLEPLTITTPKTMVPVINKPFLEYLIDRLKGCGITSIVLSAGHLADSIPEYFGSGERFGVDLHYVVEKAPLGVLNHSSENSHPDPVAPYVHSSKL
jgi:mannose-1-phosphate guanylyltransferase